MIQPAISNPEAHRAGYVGLIGRPNVGKSTLLNRVLGQKVSITSPKPQTTRNRVVGIWNGAGVQALLVDTPGIHNALDPLNQAMVTAALTTLEQVEVVCWIVDAAEAAARVRHGEPAIGTADENLATRIEATGSPVVLAFNKIDRIEPLQLLPLIDAWRQRLELAACVPISAMDGDGVPALLDEISTLLPEHPPFYPADQLTEQTERFLVAEMIRERIFHLTEREIPYATAVEIEVFDESERDGPKPLVRIAARILVERPSQKAIVIGRRGSMIRQIGTDARKDIEDLLDTHVFLELFVAVEPGWSEKTRALRELGLT